MHDNSTTVRRRRAWARRPTLALAATVAGLTLTSCGIGAGLTGTSQPAPDSPATAGTARAALETLATKGRAPTTGYSRDAFGQAWTDDVSVTWGRNGCDTRNDILARDLLAVTFKPGTRDCLVLSGLFPDPYGGRRVAFARGEDTSFHVQIDHVVALSDAWQTGAQGWHRDTRADFANDPLNLLAAAGALNSAKGASDAASWLPPNKPFRCEYVARQIAVKAKYDLWVKPAERAAMTTVLGSCPDQPLPTDTDATVPTAASAAVDLSDSPDVRDVPDDARHRGPYENCAAARAAGAAPVFAGDPGYSRRLDGDGDGVACE